MKLSEYIKQYRKDHSMSQRAFAEKCGLTCGYISMLEREKNPTTGKPIIPTLDTLKALADGMGIGINNLIDQMEDMPVKVQAENPSPKNIFKMPSMSRVKILSSIPCGDPSLAEEEVIGETMLPDDWRTDYALQCSGNSMEPEIHDGDLVAIHRTEEQPVNGTICAVAIDGEATLKKFYKFPDYIELRAINPEFQSIVIVGPKMASVQIYGVAVGMMRNFSR